MKKKRILGLIAVILLIALLPFPKRVKRVYYGVNTENGETVDITLDMNYFRFLFFQDNMYGTITVKTDTETFTYGEHLHYLGPTYAEQEKDTAHNFSGWYYNETMYMKEYENGAVSEMPIGFEGLMVHISSDFDKILIFHNTTFENATGVIETRENSKYLGTTEQNQIEKTKEYFSGYYD